MAGYEGGSGLYFPVGAESHRYHPKQRVLGRESARVFSRGGAPPPAIAGCRFAWYAFHPWTEVFTAGR